MNAKFVALSLTPLSRDIILLVITERLVWQVAAEESLYDTFDCPMCGCQVIAKERKRDCIPFISTDEEDADDDQI
mgnify:CR=1 FL=1